MRNPVVAAGRLVALAALTAAGCAPAGPEHPSRFARTDYRQLLRDAAEQSGPAGASSALPDKPSLDDYLTHAAARNPQMRAAFARFRAAVERIPQVTSLPDPKLSYTYYVREVETRVGPQRQAVSMSQTFPWLGKLRLAGDAAAANARATWQRFQQVRLSTFHEVRSAYYEYHYLARSLEITRENLKLLKSVEKILLTRYKSDSAKRTDLIRLQVEIGRLDDRLTSLGDRRSAASARLAAAVHLPDRDRPLPWPTDELELREDDPNDQQLVNALRKRSPALAALDEQVDAADARVQLARKGYYPDVSLGLTWIDTASSDRPGRPSDDGKDAWLAAVSVNLPIWWDRIRAGIAEARHQRLAASLDKSSRTQTLIAELREASFRYRDAGRKIRLYQRILLPKAREAVEVTQTAYQGNTAGFTDLIDAQRVLLEFQLSLARARTDRAMGLSKLTSLVGQVPTDSGTTRPDTSVE